MHLISVSVVLFFFTINCAYAQVSKIAHKRIKTLTSEKFFGRGYVKGGDSIAAVYLSKQFKKVGLQPFGENYFQPFYMDVNTFPHQMQVNVSGVNIKPGLQFIVDAAACSATGRYSLYFVSDSVLPQPEPNLAYVIKKKFFATPQNKSDLKSWLQKIPDGSGIIYIEAEKLTWTVATNQNKYWGISVLESAWPSTADSITINISAQFKHNYKTQNVIGYLPGSSDTCLVVTAHYDHLGGMGKDVFFPGANDNASGVSMLLSLATHFANLHERKYSMLFIAFAAEEAGLIGSKHYVENPVMPLSMIRFLINLDLLGTGDEGIMVVNATQYPSDFNLLDSINTSNAWLPAVRKRGKAANSDHYWFSEAGVPAFFIYTLGGITAYHDVKDVAKTLPLTKYDDVFKLIKTFMHSF
jgi:aminopeptidase YwaD